MNLGRKKMLAAFLEKDNLKLLVYDVFGSKAVRTFAGQISFSPEVLKDAYISDPVKFAGQVKMALLAKEPLQQSTEVVLFVPADKTFAKSLPVADAVDSFIQSLPYFAEELVLTSEKPLEKGKGQEKITHIAFEKKLVEDFQRPFMESGKKVLFAKSGLNLLAVNFGQGGKYFLLVPLDKEIAVAVVEDGAVLEMAVFGKDVFVTRFGEFVLNHNLETVRQAYTVGVFDADLANKVRSERGVEVVSLVAGDVYDVMVGSLAKSTNPGMLGSLLGGLDLMAIKEKLPERRRLLLIGAVGVAILLIVLLVRGVGAKLGGSKQPTVSPVAAPAPAPLPEPKPADYKVRILNGTLIEGEAGRLGESLKGLGFDVVETKNATSAGFVATRIRTVADVPTKIVDKIKSSLDTYESVTLEPLASDSAGVTIEVIIGKKK